MFFGGARSPASSCSRHVQTRFDIWLRPVRRTTTQAPRQRCQIVEAMFGMGWGGLIGRGFGNGDPERMPYAESDFIVAAIGEELGLTGVMAVHPDVRPDRRARLAHRAGLPRRASAS